MVCFFAFCLFGLVGLFDCCVTFVGYCLVFCFGFSGLLYCGWLGPQFAFDCFVGDLGGLALDLYWWVWVVYRLPVILVCWGFVGLQLVL